MKSFNTNELIAPDVKKKNGIRRRFINKSKDRRRSGFRNVYSKPIIINGITVGKNTIIGAGSVVTKNIPDNVIAYGNPCKIVRSIDET